VSGRDTIRSGLRLAHRIALFAVAASAASLADGSGGGALAAPKFVNEVEGALVRTMLGLREGGMRTALTEIDRALERNPNFRLGHLIRGDILMARAGKPSVFAASLAATETVAPLQDEARVRLKRYAAAPPVEALPAPLLQMSPSQSHALLVDTSRSRLFVYANERGKPRYVTDFYISLGKNGIDKTREGDQKTPVGVYTIIGQKEKLPDFYGPGAFPISYPNDWDKLNKRNGHGIWLHGTPSETYSRAPFATDGCVVLTNEDLGKLSRYVEVSKTPVVIGNGVEWRDPQRWESERSQFMKAFEQWKGDWESRDTDRYLSHYSGRFREGEGSYDAWKARKKKVNSGKTWIKVGVEDLSVFAYPGAEPMMMVTFEQDYRSSNLSNRTTKRQYWVREGPAWRILHEAIVS
jgi:murein L,D-transpeptidase YafK